MGTAERRALASRTKSSTLDWGIESIVADLRRLRDQSLAVRQRVGKPAKLPSRKALRSVVEGLRAAFFPHRLSSRELVEGSVDFFVGHTLDTALCELADQVVRELDLSADRSGSKSGLRDQAVELVRQYAAELPRIRAVLESDLQAAYHGDAAARSIDEVLAYYPGITAVSYHRLAHSLYRLGLPLIARIIGEIAHSLTGIDIHPGARIDDSFFIDHGTGVVIGETAVIGRRVRQYHGVTLGAAPGSLDEAEKRDHQTIRHPTVEDDVVIFAGATILGPITIGRGSLIGGNVWLTRSVESGSRISQAKVLHEDFGGGMGI